jgi:hypothetical protein
VQGRPAVHAHRQGRRDRAGPDFAAFWEGILAALLLIAARAVVVHQLQADPRAQHLRGVLVIQSLPFLAAVGLALLEGSRFNEFAYWRGVEAKVAEPPACRRNRGSRARRRRPHA